MPQTDWTTLYRVGYTCGATLNLPLVYAGTLNGRSGVTPIPSLVQANQYGFAEAMTVQTRPAQTGAAEVTFAVVYSSSLAAPVVTLTNMTTTGAFPWDGAQLTQYVRNSLALLTPPMRPSTYQGPPGVINDIRMVSGLGTRPTTPTTATGVSGAAEESRAGQQVQWDRFDQWHRRRQWLANEDRRLRHLEQQMGLPDPVWSDVDLEIEWERDEQALRLAVTNGPGEEQDSLFRACQERSFQRETEIQRRRQVLIEAEIQARQRARSLLVEMLNDDQKRTYEQHQYFEVVGSEGRRYRIRQGVANNVHALDARGREYETWCAHPLGIPEWDCMLAQKLWIEANEAAFRAVANHHRGGSGME